MAGWRVGGDVYVGDYSPDANAANPERGPAGHGRWMLVKRPANYGWPYCVTPDMPYVDYDFATKTSGEEFNCNAPTNDSPYNTGLKRLPAVAQPDVWYSYATSPLFPELGPEGTPGGIAPMGGPAYDPVPGNSSVFRFPNTGAFYHAVQEDGIELSASWLVSDDVHEIAAASRAGARTISVGQCRRLNDDVLDIEADDQAATLCEAIEAILSGDPLRRV